MSPYDSLYGYLINATCFVAQMVKNLPAVWETGFDPWVGKIPWRNEQLSTLIFWPRQFHGPYSQWVQSAKSQIGLSDFHFHFPSPKLGVSRLALHVLMDASL